VFASYCWSCSSVSKDRRAQSRHRDTLRGGRGFSLSMSFYYIVLDN